MQAYLLYYTLPLCNPNRIHTLRLHEIMVFKGTKHTTKGICVDVNSSK